MIFFVGEDLDVINASKMLDLNSWLSFPFPSSSNHYNYERLSFLWDSLSRYYLLHLITRL